MVLAGSEQTPPLLQAPSYIKRLSCIMGNVGRMSVINKPDILTNIFHKDQIINQLQLQ